jgi:dienelactone hydrolase
VVADIAAEAEAEAEAAVAKAKATANGRRLESRRHRFNDSLERRVSSPGVFRFVANCRNCVGTPRYVVRMRYAALLFLLLATSVDAAPRYWGLLEPGPHDVGFRLIRGESAVGAAGYKPRPIEIAVWYPASRTGSALTFGDYWRAAPDVRGTVAEAITGDASGIDDAKAAAILATPMFARRDATPTDGTFPVVLWSARYGTTAAQSVMSEYLASHGYVVAFARPLEASAKLPFELKTPVEKLDELNAQVEDMRGALRAVRDLAGVDPTRTALLAWSYAGESATRLQWSDATVRGVIGLSTNLRTGWVYQSTDAMNALSSAPQSVPFVHLTEKEGAEFRALAHGNFNALEGMIPAVEGIEKVQKWSRSGPEAKAGYEAIARRVRQTLNSFFVGARVSSPAPVELTSSDKVRVTAEAYRAKSPRGCILMVHQSGSSRGEFRTIAPELVKEGFTTLAIDGRWGRRDYWNAVWNETARRYGTIEVMDRKDTEAARKIESTNDIIAGANWLKVNGCRSIIVWGSSIHANAVMKLASTEPALLKAAVAFSPGDYRGRYAEGEMRAIAERIKVPTFIAIAADEEDIASPVYQGVAPERLTLYRSIGRHGSAILFEDPMAWRELKAFLNKVISN